MTDTPPDKTPVLGVDWSKAVAGALAAVSTTVLLSTLGAAGTLIGAALGSLAATIGTAVYSVGLERSRERVRRLSGLATGAVRLPGAPQEVETPEAARVGGWRDRLRGLRWSRLLLTAVAVFLVVLVAVTAFELLAGRTLASTVGGGSKGGTTLSHVTEGGGGGRDRDRTPTPGTSTGPSATPSTATAEPSPSDGASEEPSSTPSEQPTESSSPTVGSSPSASDTPTPTATSSPDGPAERAPTAQAPPAD